MKNFTLKPKFDLIFVGVDLSDFFPVERPQQLVDFMDKSHADWNSRRKEFYNFLFNCVTDTKKNFTKAILKTLFTRQYMMKVKWPTFG